MRKVDDGEKKRKEKKSAKQDTQPLKGRDLQKI